MSSPLQFTLLLLLCFVLVSCCGALLHNLKSDDSYFELASPRPKDMLSADSCDSRDHCHYMVYIYGWWQGEIQTAAQFPVSMHLAVRSRAGDYDEMSFNVEKAYPTEQNLYVVGLIYQMTMPISILSVEMDIVIKSASTNILLSTNTVQLALYQHTKSMTNSLLTHYEAFVHYYTDYYDPSSSFSFSSNYLRSSSSSKSGEVAGGNVFLGEKLRREIKRKDRRRGKKRKLDFLEIGTNDFDTVLQEVHRRRQQTSVQTERSIYADMKVDEGGDDDEKEEEEEEEDIIGITMEAVAQYLDNLPDVPGVFKVNAAVSLEKNQAPSVEVYYFPESTLDTLELTRSFVRGCIQVNEIHPNIFYQLYTRGLPSALIKRDTVCALSISFLMNNYIYPYFDGLKLLKLDIEGLDQGVVKDLIDYMLVDSTSSSSSLDSIESDRGRSSIKNSSSSNSINSAWPCVLFFETNVERDEALLDTLSALGYRLYNRELSMDDFPVMTSDYEGRTREYSFEGADTLAVNCLCKTRDVRQGMSLLAPLRFKDTAIAALCKSR